MKSFFFACLLSIISTVTLEKTNPVPLINQPLVPDVAVPGGPEFKLTVNGTGFVSGAVVNWDGQPLTTTFVSRLKVTAGVPASYIAKAGMASVTVVNPPPGGGTSNVMYFDVSNPGSALALATFDTDLGDGGVWGLLAADFNGDGVLDLAGIGNEDIYVQLGNGDGSFQLPKYYSGGSNDQALLAADVNGDGKLDLVVANAAENTISVYLGNGDGSFQSPKVFPTGLTPIFLAAGDFNGDGRLDLAVGCNGNGVDSGSISILLGKGDGTFQQHADYVPPGTGLQTVNAMAMGDFNRDNKLDVALSDSEAGQLFILQGKGDGTFQFTRGVGTAAHAVWMLAVDVNRDGKLDLVMAQQQLEGEVAVFLGNGDGTFQASVEYETDGESPIRVVAGDFNADGKLDLALPNSNSGTVAVLLGNGDGSFQSPVLIPVPPNPGDSGPFSIAPGDFNGDGKLDLAVLNNPNNLGYYSAVLLQGLFPALALTPQSLTFGQQQIGTTSPPHMVTLTNTGTTILTISSIRVTGVNAADFAVINTCPSILVPTQKCQVSVTFTPTAAGDRVAALSVTDNGPGSPQNVSLSGTGIGP